MFFPFPIENVAANALFYLLIFVFALLLWREHSHFKTRRRLQDHNEELARMIVSIYHSDPADGLSSLDSTEVVTDKARA